MQAVHIPSVPLRLPPNQVCPLCDTNADLNTKGKRKPENIRQLVAVLPARLILHAE